METYFMFINMCNRICYENNFIIEIVCFKENVMMLKFSFLRGVSCGSFVVSLFWMIISGRKMKRQ